MVKSKKLLAIGAVLEIAFPGVFPKSGPYVKTSANPNFGVNSAKKGKGGGNASQRNNKNFASRKQ